jgi:four helix bundle protein
MQEYRFERLRVYQDAMNLVEKVYELCRKLPSDEKYALADQLKRSSVSVVLNIAEGSGGLGDIEYKSFLRVSLKSLYETVAGLKVGARLFQINVNEALEQCNKVGKELNALIKSFGGSRLVTKD